MQAFEVSGMNENQHELKLKRQELIKRCHSLIDAIARSPGCIKLLTLAKTHLEMLANYKGNRQQRARVIR